MEITQRQKDIIIGTLLGDGYIEISKEGSTRLQLKQSEEKKEYIFWLYKELGNLCRSAPKQRKDNNQWYFNTRYVQELKPLRQYFYLKNVKIIPRDIRNLLTQPISIAVWFMDDGTLDWRIKSHYAFRLSTHAFSLTENKILTDVLKINFGIIASVQTTLIRHKRYPRIHIGTTGRDQFLQLIKPFILSCFNHKLPPIIFNPSETQLILTG